MATITIPAGGVAIANTTVRPSFGVGGASLNGGQCVYIDTGDANELKATNVAAAASAKCAGILLQDSADGEGAVYLADGCEVTGPTFTEGVWYVCDNSGAIAEYSDLTAGEYVTYVGYGNSAGNLVVQIVVTGETK